MFKDTTLSVTRLIFFLFHLYVLLLVFKELEMPYSKEHPPRCLEIGKQVFFDTVLGTCQSFWADKDLRTQCVHWLTLGREQKVFREAQPSQRVGTEWPAAESPL